MAGSSVNVSLQHAPPPTSLRHKEQHAAAGSARQNPDTKDLSSLSTFNNHLPPSTAIVLAPPLFAPTLSAKSSGALYVFPLHVLGPACRKLVLTSGNNANQKAKADAIKFVGDGIVDQLAWEHIFDNWDHLPMKFLQSVHRTTVTNKSMAFKLQHLDIFPQLSNLTLAIDKKLGDRLETAVAAIHLTDSSKTKPLVKTLFLTDIDNAIQWAMSVVEHLWEMGSAPASLRDVRMYAEHYEGKYRYCLDYG